MSLAPVQVQTIAQELPSGYSVNIDSLFSTTDAEGLPITEYMFRTSGGSSIQLNGAVNLANASESANGYVVVSTADLAKVTIQASSIYTSGLTDLYISAFDGVSWSSQTGEALTITANATAISPTPRVVIQAGSSIAASSLFTVSGYLDLNPADVYYTLDPAPGSGVIQGNGAYNYGAETFPGTFKVRGTELNLLTYEAPSTPGYYNFVINVLPSNDGQPWSDWGQVDVTVTGPATSAAAEIENASAGKPLYAAYVSDSAANVAANLDALQSNLSAGILLGVTLTDNNPALSVSAPQFIADRGVLALIADADGVSVTVTGMTVEQAASLAAPGNMGYVAPLDLTGSAADLAASFDALALEISSGLAIANISLTDAGTPVLHLTDQQALRGQYTVLPLISGSYSITIDDAAADEVAPLGRLPHMGAISVSDTAVEVRNYLPDLALAAQSGLLTGITFTDSGIPVLTLDASWVAGDLPALQDIASPFVLDVQVSTNQSATGLAGHGSAAVFTGAAASYSIASDGVSGLAITGLNTNYVNHLTGMDALQFSDVTVIVAQAPSATTPTSGNIAELYAAVLGRVPDVAGFAYYSGVLAANPATPMIAFAEDFLQAPEYTQAHNYAQTAAGDAQFITDTYQNLLHRAPSSTDVAWYQMNVLNPVLANATPGSAAYTAAELQAHAQLLVDFSASGEFLANVQITAAHPADAQHWLFLS